MKIRIKGNSLRYRLTKTDVERFAEEGYLEEQTVFGNGVLTYALQVYGSNELSASFEDNKITLFMPEIMAEDWATTDRVGFEETAGPLYLLIEKDFKCLDNVAEDQSDNYPNPLLTKQLS
jgi:3-methyladenine DNA glycosylase Mpg